MSETLGQKQRRFSRFIVHLLRHAQMLGYEFKFGNALRTDEQAEINAIKAEGRERVAKLIEAEFPALATKIRNNGRNNGVRMSTHLLALAIDIDLFRNGVYLSATEDHRELGEFWEKLAPDCRWGGRFGDGNHYSLEHEGIK